MQNIKTLLVAGLCFATLGTPKDADACSCLPPTVQSSHGWADDVIIARVAFGVEVGQTQWYIVRTRKVIKGCLKAKQWVYVKTNTSSAACGATLQLGKTYLLNGGNVGKSWGVDTLSIGSCSMNVPVSQLNQAERKWLLSRTNCCKDKCQCTGGQPLVNCFVDPCTVNSCPTGTCTANYCGGCGAEFYDDTGNPVCTGCEDQDDCAWNQVCSDGLCQSGCSTDKDCNEGFWCSPGFEGGMACKPFQGEGEFCGGFTPVWAQAKCAPGLICTDVPALIADAPGTCLAECEDNSECPSSQYCSGDGVCRDDGSCFDSNKDCNKKGNDYPHIECVGAGVCQQGACGWECGASSDELTWYTTCGDPVCQEPDPPSGVVECKKGQKLGNPCDGEGDVCDAGLGCGALLICAGKDPKQQPGGCPISQRDTKEKIDYLDTAQLSTMHAHVMQTKLATWRYKEGPQKARRLGFIIEDQPQDSPSVAYGGEKVDVYAYASMAVAALQVQQQQIELLQQQVEALKAAIQTAPARMCGQTLQ